MKVALKKYVFEAVLYTGLASQLNDSVGINNWEITADKGIRIKQKFTMQKPHWVNCKVGDTLVHVVVDMEDYWAVHSPAQADQYLEIIEE